MFAAVGNIIQFVDVCISTRFKKYLCAITVA